jgi:Mrp family chromosome partitioning ATPase
MTTQLLLELPAVEPAGGTTLAAAVRRYRVLITSLVLAGALAGFGVSLLRPPTYQATAHLLLKDPRSSLVFGETLWEASDSGRYLSNQATRLTSRDVLARAARVTGLGTGDKLSTLVSAVPSSEGDLITVTAAGGSPEAAERLADAIVAAYEDAVVEDRRALAAELGRAAEAVQQRLDAAKQRLAADPENPAALAERDAADASLAAVQGRTQQVEVDAALFGTGVRTADPAEAEGSPLGGTPARNGLLAAVLLLLASVAGAWARSGANPTVERSADAAALLRVPALGEVRGLPRQAGLLVGGPASAAVEDLRAAAMLMQLAAGRTGVRTVAVMDVERGTAASSVALNAAVALGEAGQRGVLVDADVSGRHLTAWAGLSSLPGLTDPGNLNARLVAGDRLVEGTADWSLLPAGSGAVRAARACRELATLEQGADLVLVAAPPLLASADALVAAEQAGAVVLVIRQCTPLRLLADAQARLEAAGVPVLGFVLARRGRRPGRAAQVLPRTTSASPVPQPAQAAA